MKSFSYTLWRGYEEGFTPATYTEMTGIFGRKGLRRMQRIAEDPTRPNAFAWCGIDGEMRFCNVFFLRQYKRIDVYV